ncbi:LppX_LprAFG lipoprotein [Kineococcus rubinsiae]|uniref:LppX_LprAFG lipoprotein n=1 Tax=Kineococcus rubinsiae TaxID=2609562 RepID=UPI00142FF3B3|nr:LppX_LprAFG lipoprotein [Kineococcus rubinsiae]
MQTTTRNRTTKTWSRGRLASFSVAGAAVLALGLGACSSGGDSAAAPSVASPATQLSAFQVVQASSQQSKEAGSAKFALDVSGTAQGQAVAVTGEGAFDAATQAFEMKLTLPQQAGGTAVTLRLVDGTAYLSGAPLTAAGQWIEVPLDALAQQGLDTSTVDPAKQLEQLQAAASDVKEVPGTTVRGVEAKGYAGTIDVQKAYDQLPAEQKTPEAQQAITEAGITSIPFTLYVDDQNRPVRVVEEITAQGSTVKVSTDFYDWGSDVAVAVPDPASVTEMPGMAAMQGAAAPAQS